MCHSLVVTVRASGVAHVDSIWRRKDGVGSGVCRRMAVQREILANELRAH